MVESVTENSSPELRAAIDVAKSRIKVDSYYTRAMISSTRGRTQGLISGTILGFFGGMLVGGGVSVLLAMVAGPMALPVAMTNLIGFPLVLGIGGLGAAMGGTGGMIIGAPAGAIAGTMAEKERRESAEKLEKEILASPEKQAEAIAAYRKDPVIERADTIREVAATTPSRGKFWSKVIDWRTVLFAMAICTLSGMALCAGPHMLGIPIGYGLVANSLPTALFVGGALGAATGALFGINVPLLYTSLTEKAADMLSGRMVRGKTQYAPVKTVAQSQEEAIRNRAMSEPSGNVVAIRSPANSQAAFAMVDQPLTAVNQVVASDRVAQPVAALSHQ